MCFDMLNVDVVMRLKSAEPEVMMYSRPAAFVRLRDRIIKGIRVGSKHPAPIWFDGQSALRDSFVMSPYSHISRSSFKHQMIFKIGC